MVTVKVNGKPLLMEVDTGAVVSSRDTQAAQFPEAVLAKATLKLHTYTSQPMGQITVWVRHNGFKGDPVLVVMSRNGPSMMGWNWLEQTGPASEWCVA